MSLTGEQLSALWRPDGSPVQGLNVVSARPGTGKTTTVAEYCIDVVDRWRDYKPWQGMAVLSYTNVARQELEQRFSRRGKSNALLASPHFVGTIDAFINQFVFLPFGAREMGFAGGRPRLVGEPYSFWRATDEVKAGLPPIASSLLFFDCYSLDADDAPLIVDKTPRRVNFRQTRVAAKPSSSNTKNIVAMKRHVWAQGLATQCDANYLTYKTLAGSAILAQSIARRFPVLVIDEAQDMTAVQHALLTQLMAAGQTQVVLVGDEYQAIYEWNTAKPQLFVARKTENGWRPQTLSETFRCSPAICGALARMMADGKAIQVAAGGKNKNYTEPVQVRAYGPANEKDDVLAAVCDMARLLSDVQPHDEGADSRTIAVVARSSDSVSRLQGYFAGGSALLQDAPEWADMQTKNFLRVIHYLLSNDLYGAATAYETVLFNSGEYASRREMRRVLTENWRLGESTLVAYRSTLVADLRKIEAQLPIGQDVTISSCVTFFDVDLVGMPRKWLKRTQGECAAFASAKQSQDASLSSLFTANDARVYFPHAQYPDIRVTFSTVHGVKGETYDGVVFYTKARSNGCGCSPGGSNMWAKILTHNLVECEHKRIAYVALSRAAQVLFVLAPDASTKAWASLLED